MKCTDCGAEIHVHRHAGRTNPYNGKNSDVPRGLTVCTRHECPPSDKGGNDT